MSKAGGVRGGEAGASPGSVLTDAPGAGALPEVLSALPPGGISRGPAESGAAASLQEGSADSSAPAGPGAPAASLRDGSH